MPFGIGATEMIILLVVILVVFGPKRLPEMGRSLGKGMREFKDSISGKNDDDDERDEPVQHAIGTRDTIAPEATREQRETERIP
ncbi:MAG TPA: twin-arginine translocase TatA/TatE family subunit [Gaiellaceae bacterium]|jgi:sec-independent protein translocase protein TatA